MNLKKRISATIAALTLSVSSVTLLCAYAMELGADGDLDWRGGQTDKIVYSEIARKAGRQRNYMCKAAVKVGGNTYNADWELNHSYKDAKRKWYANESYYYDYYYISQY